MYNPRCSEEELVKSKEKYKVRLKIGDAEIDVEGAEAGVVKIVEALSDALRPARRVGSPPASEGSPTVASTPAPRGAPVDIRSFFQEKTPSSDVEAAAVAAYYYQYLAPEASRRETVDADLLSEAFRLGRRPLPATAIYTLQNARNAGYLDSTGESGYYRLNPVGYNLVEHTLGGSEAVEGKKRRTAKKSRKKAQRRKKRR